MDSVGGGSARGSGGRPAAADQSDELLLELEPESLEPELELDESELLELEDELDDEDDDPPLFEP